MSVIYDRFILRKWAMQDAPSLIFHANNPNIAKNLRDRFPHPYTEKDATDFLTATIAKPDPICDFAIDIDGEAVGGVGIVPQQDVERISAEIGYWLGETYWNRGIMTEVIRKTAQYVFENFSITKLFAPVFEFNIGSQRVLEKAGFQREGIMRKAAVKDGRVIDLHYYGIVKDKTV